MHRTGDTEPHRADVVVVGGGQSGLATGYFLKQHRVDFVILLNVQVISGILFLQKGCCFSCPDARQLVSRLIGNNYHLPLNRKAIDEPSFKR